MSTLAANYVKNPSSSSNNLTLGTDGTVQGIISRGTTVASTSGTSIDFTGIPSFVKRITVMLNQVSLSGTSNVCIQLGTSGGVDTASTYVGATQNGGGASYFTTSFQISRAMAAASHPSDVWCLLGGEALPVTKRLPLCAMPFTHASCQA